MILTEVRVGLKSIGTAKHRHIFSGSLVSLAIVFVCLLSVSACTCLVGREQD